MADVASVLAEAGLTVTRPAFGPVGSLEGRANYKTLLVVRRDGTIVERVSLDVPDPAHREQLICIHYLRNAVRTFWREPKGVNILGRDDPWDFKLEISDEPIFWLEITAIAEDERRFRKLRNEARLQAWCGKEKIPFGELLKLSRIFDSPTLSAFVDKLAEDRLGKTDLVSNPLRDQEAFLFMGGGLHSDKPLEEKLLEAIKKKASKKHSNKESTVLIIDNRTSLFDIEDFRAAFAKIDDEICSVPFKEIWLYTGFFSENDGNEAEFCLMVVKLPRERAETMLAVANERGVDEHKRVMW